MLLAMHKQLHSIDLFIIFGGYDFLVIRLCQECQTLIENHDKIKLLSNARNNLNTTLKVGKPFLVYIILSVMIILCMCACLQYV